VFASNTRAIRLYERLGFVHEGVRHRARKIDGAYDDNVMIGADLRRLTGRLRPRRRCSARSSAFRSESTPPGGEPPRVAPDWRHVRFVFLPTRTPHSAGSAVSAARESWTIEAERCRMAVESALPDASVELYFNLGPFGRHLRGSASGLGLVHRAAWVVGPRDQHSTS
jgi:hypothetical protein